MNGSEIWWREDGSESGEVMGPDTCRRGGVLAAERLRSSWLIMRHARDGRCAREDGSARSQRDCPMAPRSSHTVREPLPRGPACRSDSVHRETKLGRRALEKRWMGRHGFSPGASFPFSSLFLFILFFFSLFPNSTLSSNLNSNLVPKYIVKLKVRNFRNINIYIYYLYFHIPSLFLIFKS
jgi:hypothetical protein